MSRTRILIVNEEQVLREFFRFNLTRRGYEVLECPGDSGVFDVITKEKPDLVIMDLMVSGADGFEICRRICEAQEPSLIVFNMRGGEADLLRCLEIGVDDYMGKPFGVNELIARIHAVLRHKRVSMAANCTN
jgi:two-component system, OmpR family, KDP operon response regulator KdpE